VVVDRPDLGQARIAVGHEGIARADEDRIAVSLFNLVLGGSGFSSRLMDALRGSEGLTYGVSSGYSLRRAPGPFVRSTFTRVEKTRAALDILLAELDARAQRAARRGRAVVGAHARDGQLRDGARDLRRRDRRAGRPRRVCFFFFCFFFFFFFFFFCFFLF
jgi:predicted Zn-dependent peptidase